MASSTGRRQFASDNYAGICPEAWAGMQAANTGHAPDVLCLGGAKSGLAMGEAVVFFDKSLAQEFDYRCKQAGQLCAKMRFLAAPWIGILTDGAWLRHAAHANACAALLAERIEGVRGVRIMFPRQANSVFLDMPADVAHGLQERGWHFYTFIGCGGGRFMCSWDTTREDVEALAKDIRELADRHAARTPRP